MCHAKFVHHCFQVYFAFTFLACTHPDEDMEPVLVWGTHLGYIILPLEYIILPLVVVNRGVASSTTVVRGVVLHFQSFILVL